MCLTQNIGCFEINIFVKDRLNLETLKSLSGKPIKRFRTVCGLNPNPKHTQADPFLFVYRERLYLFYETDGYKLGRGVITMVSTSDLCTWTKPKIVLQEPFHLSYPLVFEKDGAVYMIPESGASGQICLYQAVDNSLTRFEPTKVLLKGRYLDSFLLERDSKYFLFTSSEPQYRQYVLHLFCSDKFDGPYIEHPKSPICYDTEFSRCGGKPIEIDGKICRVSQDCSNGYGDNVSLVSIDSISEKDYIENVYCRNVFNRECEPFKGGGHHLTCVKFKGQYVIATDCKTSHWGLRNIYSFMTRLKRIIKR